MHSVITVMLVMTNHLYIFSTFLESLLIFNKVNNITNSNNRSTFFLSIYVLRKCVRICSKFGCKRVRRLGILTHYKL